MLSAIDIDGVIASRIRAYSEFYRQEIHLNLTDEAIAAFTRYEDLFNYPEIKAYRKRNEEQFQLLRAKALESIQVIRRCEPLPEAVEKVQHLATLGTVKYYTIRKSRDPEVAQQLQRETRHWLARHGFPNPDAVIFPKTFTAKLGSVAQERDEHIIFFDDRWADLIGAFDTLKSRLPDNKALEKFRQRLILVAFGASSVPEITNGLRVVALPSWKTVDELFPLCLPAHSASSEKEEHRGHSVT